MGANKQSLFSRMSPTNKLSGGGVDSSKAGGGQDAKAIARTQASTQNIASPSMNADGGRNIGSRGARSPFREAMSRGVLSGAGLLTH